MSLTTTPTKSCGLDSINKSITEATLYTAFYYPKTQSEAIKLIYGIDKSTISIFGEDRGRTHKSTSNINITPITNARKKLLMRGFLFKMDEKLRNSTFKASPIPITNYIKNKIRLRKSRRNPNPSEDYDALSIILDSELFRSFFSNNFLLNPPTHLPLKRPDFVIVDDDDEAPPSLYHPFGYILRKRTSENMIHYSKLEVYDVVNLFSYLIEDIGAYSWGILPVLKKFHDFVPLTTQEILQNGDFDDIIQKYEDSVPKAAIFDFFSYCIEGDNFPDWCAPSNPRRFIENITIQSALIPTTISEIMVRAGRIPLTLIQEIKNLQFQIYNID